MERRDFLAVWGFGTLVVFVLTLVRGAGVVNSLVAGVFVGGIMALLVHMGAEKIHE